MDEITPPVTAAKVGALTTKWADKPRTVVAVAHQGFNQDEHMGGFAFQCDRGLLIYGLDGGGRRWCSPGTDAERFAMVDQFWRESRDQAREFRDDDAGYLVWLKAYPDGYVLNILRSHNPAGARIHRAHCRWINDTGQPGEWTKQYVKVCAKQLTDLEQCLTAMDLELEPLQGCTCPPAPGAAGPTSTKPTGPVVELPAPEGRWDIDGPVEGSPMVEAWADDYVHFQNRPAWQDQLRDAIRSRCRQLVPTEGEVLHATFFGAKRPNADVENLVLYNIDSFGVAGRNGIRIEYGGRHAPPAPDGGEYRFGYRYALVPQSGSFPYWQQVRPLASFDWTNLEDRTLARIWLALARRRVRGKVNPPDAPALAPGAPFGLKVELRPPHGLRTPVNADLMKVVVDGVICAFQAQTVTKDLPEVVARLAKLLHVDPDEIERLLLDQTGAVLGVVPRLVWPRMEGVQWNPSDDRCFVGEFLPAIPEPDSTCWAIKGQIFEISSSTTDS